MTRRNAIEIVGEQPDFSGAGSHDIRAGFDTAHSSDRGVGEPKWRQRQLAAIDWFATVNREAPFAWRSASDHPFHPAIEILAADEVAALLRVNRKTIYEAAQRGRTGRVWARVCV